MGAWLVLAEAARRLAIVLAAALALAGCKEADTQPPLQATPALWGIYASAGDEASGEPAGWLFGTIHALPRDVIWCTDRLDEAMRRAGVLVVEVKGLAHEGEAIAATFRRMATDRPPPAPLAGRVAPPLRDAFARLLARPAAIRPDDRTETWAAALILAQAAQTGDPALGADRALITAFDRRLIVELEGATEQFAIFDALPETEQRDLLDAVIREAAAPVGTADQLSDAWLRGDVQAIEAATQKGMLADPELRAALLDNRNRAWVPAIGHLLKSGRRPLVAVGAGHMIGPEGLPALLIRQGYSVRRIQ